MNMKVGIAAVVGCVVAFPLLGLGPEHVGTAATLQGRKPPKGSTTEIATLTRLPSLGSNAEALAVNEDGTIIVGTSFDRADLLYAVTWTRQNGSWVIAKLPYPGTAARATGVDNHGNVVGYAASLLRYPVLWPAEGGYHVLGCDSEQGMANAISADGKTIVGHAVRTGAGPRAWPSPQYCGERLPLQEEGGFAATYAVNGDGSIIGGSSAPGLDDSNAPTRWTGPQGERQIEVLDARRGVVLGANATGDLAGYVTTPCASADGCQRAVIWYAAGGSKELGTLGGEHSWARDINGSGEVVGGSTSTRLGNTGYFWSESMGMFQLPAGKRWAAANGVSDVRSDGTRLVVGMDSQATAVVWVIRNP